MYNIKLPSYAETGSHQMFSLHLLLLSSYMWAVACLENNSPQNGKWNKMPHTKHNCRAAIYLQEECAVGRQLERLQPGCWRQNTSLTWTHQPLFIHLHARTYLQKPDTPSCTVLSKYFLRNQRVLHWFPPAKNPSPALQEHCVITHTLLGSTHPLLYN